MPCRRQSRSSYQEVIIAFPLVPKCQRLISRHNPFDNFPFWVDWFALGIVWHGWFLSISSICSISGFLGLANHTLLLI